MLSSSSIVHAYWVSLEDKGLFSSANILQITKKNCVYILWIFIECKLLTGLAVVGVFLRSYPNASKSSRKPMHRVWLEQRRFFARSTIAPFADSWGLTDLICIIIFSYTELDMVNSKSHQHNILTTSRACWNGPVSLPKLCFFKWVQHEHTARSDSFIWALKVVRSSISPTKLPVFSTLVLCSFRASDIANRATRTCIAIGAGEI